MWQWLRSHILSGVTENHIWTIILRYESLLVNMLRDVDTKLWRHASWTSERAAIPTCWLQLACLVSRIIWPGKSAPCKTWGRTLNSKAISMWMQPCGNTFSNQWVFQVVFSRGEDKRLTGASWCSEPLRQGSWGVALHTRNPFWEWNTVGFCHVRIRGKQHELGGKKKIKGSALVSRGSSRMHGEHHPERMHPGS